MTQKRHRAFRAARKQPSRLLAQTVPVIAPGQQDLRPCYPYALPATDCAGLRSASASKPSTSIRRIVPVREDRCTPHHRHQALTPLGRPGPGPGGSLSHTQAVGLCRRPGALGLPSVVPSKPARPTLPDTLRGQRSTAFRAIGGWETLSRTGPPRQRLPTTNASLADVRFSQSAKGNDITRTEGEERQKNIRQRAAADAAVNVRGEVTTIGAAPFEPPMSLL